jgi:hypothetical protein
MGIRVLTFAKQHAPGPGLLPALALLAALYACTDSDGNEYTRANQPGSPGSTPAPDSVPGSAGIWYGALRLDEEGPADATSDVICLVAATGELACVLLDARRTAAESLTAGVKGSMYGTVSFDSGNRASGSGTLYAAPGLVLADGASVVADFAITGGAYVYESSLNRELRLDISSLGQTLRLSTTFDHYYLQSGSLATVAMAYTSFDIFGDPASLSIDANGAVFSQSASGCVGNGQVRVLEPQLNGYAFDLTLGNCAGLDGEYLGLAAVTDFSWSNGTTNLLIAIFNTSNSIVGEAVTVY